jgi:hypothetical protein
MIRVRDKLLMKYVALSTGPYGHDEWAEENGIDNEF